MWSLHLPPSKWWAFPFLYLHSDKANVQRVGILQDMPIRKTNQLNGLFLLPLGDAHNCSLTCIRMCKIDYHLEAIYNFHHLATFHSVIVGAMLCKSQLYTWNWVFTALVPPSLYKQTCLLSEILDLHLWTHRENKYYEEYKVWLFVCVHVICV